MKEQFSGRRRFAREVGWTGRRRHYKCLDCGNDFIHDSAHALPATSRYCYACRQKLDNARRYDQGFLDQHLEAMAAGLIP